VCVTWFGAKDTRIIRAHVKKSRRRIARTAISEMRVKTAKEALSVECMLPKYIHVEYTF
jgi:hypothetical protein